MHRLYIYSSCIFSYHLFYFQSYFCQNVIQNFSLRVHMIQVFLCGFLLHVCRSFTASAEELYSNDSHQPNDDRSPPPPQPGVMISAFFSLQGYQISTASCVSSAANMKYLNHSGDLDTKIYHCVCQVSVAGDTGESMGYEKLTCTANYWECPVK